MRAKKTKKKTNPVKNDFLLEIGTEEIPAGFIDPALSQLKEKTGQLLVEQRLDFDDITTMATPRRFVLFIKGLVLKQQKASETKWGPPESAAFDNKGKPTKVYKGFQKSQGAKESQIQLKEREDKKGQYLCFIKKLPAKAAQEVLSRVLPDLISSIHFTKNMHWDDSFTFARPLRWLLALYGSQVIKLRLGKLVSSNLTYGHRIISKGPFKVKDTADYFKVIKKAGIMLDQDQRKEYIRKKLIDRAEKSGALKEFHEDLLTEVNYLSESPVVFCGSFKDEYLKLPSSVLTTTMGKHQKLFSFSSKKGLLPKFAAVLTGKPKSSAGVRKNYESVLDAKLKDSRFFYSEDTKTALEKKIESLKKVIFQKELGTVFDKIQRMVKLAKGLAQQLDLNQKETETLTRAVLLSKADLVTQMVIEFPGLQGVMGREYALISKEPTDVAQAIGEHYLPRSVSDKLPQTLAGALVSIADKIDNIAACFYLGQEPKGSYDPYALKRQATGIIRIIRHKKLSVSLEQLIAAAVQECHDYAKIIEHRKGKVTEKGGRQAACFSGQDLGRVKNKMLAFFSERTYNLLTESKYRYDLINAVLSRGCDNILNLWRRIEQLKTILDKDEFEQARTVVERTNNILKGAKEDLDGNVYESKFEDPLESELWRAYTDNSAKIKGLIDRAQYQEATLTYGRVFHDIIHKFFDKVLVNAEDSGLRLNRLLVMKHLNILYTERIADLSKIVVVST